MTWPRFTPPVSTTTAGGQVRTSCMVCHAEGVPTTSSCSGCHAPTWDELGLLMDVHFAGRPMSRRRRHETVTISGQTFGPVTCTDCHATQMELQAGHNATSDCSKCHPTPERYADARVGQVLRPGRLPHGRFERTDAREHRREPRTGRRADLLHRRLPPGLGDRQPRPDAPQRQRRRSADRSARAARSATRTARLPAASARAATPTRSTGPTAAAATRLTPRAAPTTTRRSLAAPARAQAVTAMRRQPTRRYTPTRAASPALATPRPTTTTRVRRPQHLPELPRRRNGEL